MVETDMIATHPQTPLDVLRQTFGYSSFRPHQEEIITALLSGRDVMAVMPTSAGKSICYQVPALMLDAVTIVISPLISLMADQVTTLRQAGVAAAYLNSSLSAAERNAVMSELRAGTLQLIYVAPERLDDEMFIDAVQMRGTGLIAVDEAHCISQWGNDFRPSYQRIIEFIDKLIARPPICALTATATRRIRDDITQVLGLQTPFCVVASFDRPNLSFTVERPASKKAKDRALLAYVRERSSSSGIIYCASRRSVEDVCELLCTDGLAATRYHAGLPANERERNQQDFLYDRRPIMVATNAFGMGIDKSNVSYVIHYNLPLSLENYYQEAGRAGRDGTPADCLLLYTAADVHTAEFLLSRTERNDLSANELAELHAQDEQRLSKMVFYATTTDCLRAYILRYFGEEAPAYCGSCSNCLADYEEHDERTNVLKIVSCIARVRQRCHENGSYSDAVGVGTIVDIIRGSKAKKVLERGWDTLSTYGIMSDVPVPHIRALIDELVYRGCISRTASAYPVVMLNEHSLAFLHDDSPFMVKVAKGAARPTSLSAWKSNTTSAGSASGSSRGSISSDTYEPTPEDEALYDALRELRTRIAHDQQVPPYIIFSNATLQDMCRRRPASIADFLEVSGVGSKKADQYGELFLAAIAEQHAS